MITPGYGRFIVAVHLINSSETFRNLLNAAPNAELGLQLNYKSSFPAVVAAK